MTEIITISTKGTVPDHLTDTNIFCRYAKNSEINIEPKEIHFAGFKLNEKNIQEIKFTNISDGISRFHIIPPVSKYFRLTYRKPERLVPGFHIKCTVIFTPDKARNYNDFIKIHTKDVKNNIIIPIYAYPAIKGLQVPRNIMFPVTALGNKSQRKLILHSDSEVDFNYEIVTVKDHPSIFLDPTSGIISAKKDTVIHLDFLPSDYVTCEKIINIYVSQYNFTPIACTLTGYCEPGLNRKQIMDREEEKNNVNSDLISISKLESKRKTAKSSKTKDFNSENQINTVVNSETIKKQLKMDFESRVKVAVNKEKQNQLCWQTCRGDLPISDDKIEMVKEQREVALKDYRLRIRQKADLSQCYKDLKVDKSEWTRTIGFGSDDGENEKSISTPQFVPECWIIRKSVLDKFRSAAWQIIINNRLKVRLLKLLDSKGYYEEINNSHLQPGGEFLTFYRPINGISENQLPRMELTNENKFNMSDYKLLSPYQPQYKFLDLVVPLQMKVLKYERVDTSSLDYPMQSPDLLMKSGSLIETNLESNEENSINPIIFSRKLGKLPCNDKDTSLVPFPHCCSFFDNYSSFPLYCYKSELLDDKDLIEMDWKNPKSSFLVCKKMIKPCTNNQFAALTPGSSLIPETAMKLWKKEHLEKLDYRNTNNPPTINLKMLNEEFPFLNALKDNLDKKLL